MPELQTTVSFSTPSAGGDLASQISAGYAELGIVQVGGTDVPQHIVEYVTTSAVDQYRALPAAVRPAVVASTVISTVVVPGFPGDPRRQIGLELTRGGDAGVVFLPSLLPIEPDGTVVAPGDLQAQTEFVYARADHLLAAQGLGTDSIVATVDHTTAATRAEYPRTGRVRRAHLGPVYPGAAGILQDRMLIPGALIALDVVASRHPLTAVNPGWERYAKLTYSPAVQAGPLLFLAGQGALNPVTEQALHVDDLAAQTAYTYRGVRAVLTAAGLEPADLLHVVEYLTPAAAEGAAVVEVARTQVLDGYRPPTSRVLCAGLLRPEFLIEVIAVARVR